MTKKEGDKKMQPNENNQIKIIRFPEDNIANDVFKLWGCYFILICILFPPIGIIYCCFRFCIKSEMIEKKRNERKKRKN